MNRIDEYKTAKHAHGKALRFCNLLGKSGHCQPGHLFGVTVSNVQIYHQEYPGAKNYHDATVNCPEFLRAFEQVVADSFGELANKALRSLADQAEGKRNAAREEYRELFGEALEA